MSSPKFEALLAAVHDCGEQKRKGSLKRVLSSESCKEAGNFTLEKQVSVPLSALTKFRFVGSHSTFQFKLILEFVLLVHDWQNQSDPFQVQRLASEKIKIACLCNILH
jgi:hypothetical protein